MKYIKYPLSFLLTSYVALVIGMYALQHTLIYHPSTQNVRLHEWGADDMKIVSVITADHLNLNFWYKPAASKDFPTLLHFHGNSGHIGNRVSKVRHYLNKGWGVLLVEYRGYGGNPGQPTEEGLYKDAEAALDFLQKQELKPNQIVAYGESLGTGVAVYLAVETSQKGSPFRAVILEAPYSSIVDIGVERYPFIPVSWLATDRFESLSRIRKIQSPLLIIHGDKDNVIPLKYAERLYSEALDPKQFLKIKNAGHNNLYDFGITESILNFIQSR